MSAPDARLELAESVADAGIEAALSRFGGLDRLYGEGSVARLSACRVAVVGVGGVGSWVVEALARSAIGGLTLIDADEVCIGNSNRQSPALAGNFGRLKVSVLAARVAGINPACVVEARPVFLTPATIPDLIDEGLDLVLDCCDAFRVKVELIAYARRRRLPLVVCGSAGGRVDATRIEVRDLSRTQQDALLSMIRRKLRGEFGFPRNPERYFGVPAVYSLENVRYPQADGSVSGLRPAAAGDAGNLDCGGGLGAAMHVTAAFAMAAVGRAIQMLLKP